MSETTPRPRMSRRRRLVLCATPVVLLLALVLLVPLPYSLAQPGETADVLGKQGGKPVISLSGAKAHKDDGKLLSVTIAATQPQATVRVGDVVQAWFARDRAVMPRDAVYPGGGDTRDAEKRIAAEMKDSQDKAVTAALRQLHRSPDDVKISLRLGDVGGPSAGLFFSLGIIDKLDGDGSGGSLTGGHTIAGTGTIDEKGAVGAVGGVPLKMQAARRDGARVFLLPAEQCGEAGEAPAGLRVVPVTSLSDALTALTHLRKGTTLPHC
ncbi:MULTISPECIES: S16 family serine protease [Streptomyces]|uniref:Lon proteolytic domain-containing protein n=1 Tax=Streptomyces cacaoi TaxID=1898 RepID=A0A4Y3R5G7_STRCI|nr:MULTISPECIES: S16 family serine protease [Streptomyces]NNG86388.1 hypothetical protein [Streptomyces cacaoi]QHF93276.1 hypothetical protein DEH18_04510 [Streptomyces sp. NHF165]GEB52865.1 hypothetical protein SCA03_54160 [Streptomyces cacaoi]